MKAILIYDIEAEKLEKLSEELDVSEAEIIEALLDAIEDWKIDIKDYL